MAKANDYRGQSVEELKATYEELRKKLFDLRNERAAAGRLEKPHLVKQTRQEIARVLTIVKEKQANV